MTIRLATSEDLDSIARLYINNHRQTYAGLLSEDYLSGLTVEYALEKWGKQLQNPEARIWVACEGETFLGFAAGMPDAELEQTWYLESLHVTGAARGKGVGTALIEAVKQYAYDNGYQKMSVCIVRGNDRAAALYQRLGAEHHSFFEDDFNGTPSASEKMIWNRLRQEEQPIRS
jgi:ribosomal protein S18 acetylase RimI-like enzyme